MPPRVLLLIPTTSYKAADFLAAAARLGVDVVVGTDQRQALEREAPGFTLVLDFARPDAGLRRIAAEHARAPFHAVVGTDDESALLAALAAEALGLPHNPPEAVRASRDKHETRRVTAAAGLASPWFFRWPLDGAPEEAAQRARYPCVLKPLGLSGSRGVLRVDDRPAFRAAFARVAAIVRSPASRAKGSDTDHLLVEEYLPGEEVALEGLLCAGRLHVLALFDKPDPLEGPTFAETIYVTPSRLPAERHSAVEREAAAACRALGLCEGALHAELRLCDGGPRLLEVAPRTIGGLCSRVLHFGAGVSLEELVLRHALGQDAPEPRRERAAAGVMMIPVPRAGILRGVQGLDEARDVPLVEELTLTMHVGAELVPLPEGDRYVGFIFARGDDAGAVERALREARARLELEIE